MKKNVRDKVIDFIEELSQNHDDETHAKSINGCTITERKVTATACAT